MSASVNTRKPNGLLHRQYEANILTETDEWLMIHIPVGSIIIDNIKETQYAQKRDCIGLINNHEYYNVFFEFGRGGVFHRMYINLATPATWSQKHIEWTDLELDIIQTRDDPIRIDDVDEYKEAIMNGYISSEIAAVCDRNTLMLQKAVEQGKFPFVRASYGQMTNQVKRRLTDVTYGRLLFTIFATTEVLLMSEVALDML